MSSAVSPGPTISDPDLVLIFDLDGTILSVNSFQVWGLYLLRGRFGLPLHKRLKLSLETLSVLLSRKLKGASHLDTKRRLQRLWGDAVAAETTKLAETGLIDELNTKMRPALEGVLAHLRHGRAPAVMATAAASEYALPLARHFGFLHALATPPHDHDGAYAENVGRTKRETTVAFLKEQGWDERRRVFFTDHLDDLPLIEISHLVLWFGTAQALAETRRLAPAVRIVSCAGWTAQQMLAEIDRLVSAPQAA